MTVYIVLFYDRVEAVFAEEWKAMDYIHSSVKWKHYSVIEQKVQ